MSKENNFHARLVVNGLPEMSPKELEDLKNWLETITESLLKDPKSWSKITTAKLMKTAPVHDAVADKQQELLSDAKAEAVVDNGQETE